MEGYDNDGMNFLWPAQVKAVVDSFSGRWETRNRTLFIVQCMTGFRAAEILSIKVGDVLNEDGAIEKTIRVKASNMKGGKKARSVTMNAVAIKHLNIWLKQMPSMGFISMKESLWPKNVPHGSPISYWAMWDIYTKAFQKVGLFKRYATHSARKTFAYQNYQWALEEFRQYRLNDDPIVLLCELLGHADIRATRHYVPRPKKASEALEALGANYDL